MIITVIAIVHGNKPLHPLDARTNLPIDGVHLSFPVWGSVLEPFTSLLHIMVTAPDYRKGVVAILIWVMLLTFLWRTHIARINGCNLLPNIIRGIVAMSISAGALLLYDAIALTTHFPNWTLQKDQPGIIVADLHSHTLRSHDGVVSSDENLQLHKERGFDAVVFSEHVNNLGPYVPYPTEKLTQHSIVDLPGVEIPVQYGGHYYLVVFGMDKGTPLPDSLIDKNGTIQTLATTPHLWSVARLITTVHQHGGVVIAVAYRLKGKEIQYLTKVGVDSFEYINYGHTPLSGPVHKRMLQAQQTSGVSLVASNDWHGWTGVLNAWTLIFPKPHIQQQLPIGDRLLAAIRDHDNHRIVPAVAYPVHPMNWFETVIMPFTSTMLYAKNLSYWQLASWWVWAALFTLLLKWKRQYSIHPVHLFLQLYISVASIIVLWRSGMMLHEGSQAILFPAFCWRIGSLCLVIGVLLALFSLFSLHRMIRYPYKKSYETFGRNKTFARKI